MTPETTPGFPAEIATAHEALSTTARRFLDRIAEDPRLTRRATFSGLWDAARRVVPHISGLPPGEDFGLQPWPLFLGEARRRELERAAVGVIGLVRQLPQRIFEGDPGRVSDYYGLDLEVADLVLAQPRLAESTLSRIDVVDSSDGVRVLEVNVGNLGGWQHAAFAPAYSEVPALAEFLAGEGIEAAPRDSIREVFEHVVGDAATSAPVRADGELNVLVVASDGGLTGPATHPEAAYRRAYADVLCRRSLPGRLDVVPVSRVVFAGDRVEVDGRRYHAVVEQNDGRPEPGLFAAALAGGIRQYTGPAGRVLGDKRNLAVLSMLAESDLFDPVERRLVQDFVPWTRHLRPGPVVFRGERRPLEELLRRERADLVIKAGFSFGGAEVVIGRACEPAAWDAAVGHALAAGGWVVQEYCAPRPYAGQYGIDGWAPFEAVWGLFVFGVRAGGAFLRMAPRGVAPVLNISHGAQVGLAFEVDP